MISINPLAACSQGIYTLCTCTNVYILLFLLANISMYTTEHYKLSTIIIINFDVYDEHKPIGTQQSRDIYECKFGMH